MHHRLKQDCVATEPLIANKVPNRIAEPVHFCQFLLIFTLIFRLKTNPAPKHPHFQLRNHHFRQQNRFFPQKPPIQ
jgi:hypothetical protein